MATPSGAAAAPAPPGAPGAPPAPPTDADVALALRFGAPAKTCAAPSDRAANASSGLQFCDGRSGAITLPSNIVRPCLGGAGAVRPEFSYAGPPMEQRGVFYDRNGAAFARMEQRPPPADAYHPSLASSRKVHSMWGIDVPVARAEVEARAGDTVPLTAQYAAVSHGRSVELARGGTWHGRDGDAPDGSGTIDAARGPMYDGYQFSQPIAPLPETQGDMGVPLTAADGQPRDAAHSAAAVRPSSAAALQHAANRGQRDVAPRVKAAVAASTKHGPQRAVPGAPTAHGATARPAGVALQPEALHRAPLGGTSAPALHPGAAARPVGAVTQRGQYAPPLGPAERGDAAAAAPRAAVHVPAQTQLPLPARAADHAEAATERVVARTAAPSRHPETAAPTAVAQLPGIGRAAPSHRPSSAPTLGSAPAAAPSARPGGRNDPLQRGKHLPREAQHKQVAVNVPGGLVAGPPPTTQRRAPDRVRIAPTARQRGNDPVAAPRAGVARNFRARAASSVAARHPDADVVQRGGRTVGRLPM